MKCENETLKEEMTVQEGEPNEMGLITTLSWSCGDKHGSLLLDEPYVFSKTND